MITPAQVTQEERGLLKDHFRKARTPLIRERAHTILLSADGHTPYQIAQILYRDEKTIREWIKAFHRTRMASLFPSYRGNTNASKLTDEQRKEIPRILASPPSAYGIPKAFWDVSSLREYVVAHFGVVYESPQSYHFLFKVSNFSFKLPATFDVRRNDAAIKKRLEEIRGIIAPYMADSSWVVVAGDEARITWEAVIRRVWLPKGKKSVLKVHRETQSQNFIGFLNVKTGKQHLFALSWQNQTEIIKALKLLLKKYPGKRICLVWDNAQFHKGNLIRKALENTLSSFFLVNFPPYAPDTNPQEHVWKWGKDQIANIQCGSLADLARLFRKAIMGRTYPYQI